MIRKFEFPHQKNMRALVLFRLLGVARSKGAVGMWDKVTDQFYGNSGTGDFTAPSE